MLKAKIVCKSVEVSCCYCGETLPEPSTGSFFWLLAEVDKQSTVKCENCGKLNKVSIPVRVPT